MTADATNTPVIVTLPKLPEFTQNETWLDLVNSLFNSQPKCCGHYTNAKIPLSVSKINTRISRGV